MPSIQSILEEIDQLKPVSDIAAKVMSLLDDPEAGSADLSAIISHEPALTANVLKNANSAYYGLPGKISDVKQAVVYLGIRQVIDLVLLVSCAGSLSGSHAGYGLANGELWKSAVSTAILAKDLAEIKGLKQHGLIFTGALLRDIGKIVLNQYVAGAIEKIMHRVETQTIAFSEAERLVLGIDHCKVGLLILENWNFPSSLQCIIQHYQTPLRAKGCFAEASLVHVANTMRRKMKIGLGVDDPTYPHDERVAHAMGLNETDLQKIMDGFLVKIEQVNALFEPI
jgi:HD-like signal output (HDOD) protein